MQAVHYGLEPLETRTMLTATPLYWDPSGAATASGGTGTWDTATAEWRSGSATGPLVAWSNSGDANGPYQAIMGAASGSTTLGANVTVASISFAVDGYSISGSSSLTFVGGQVDVAPGSTATIATPISAGTGLTKTDSGTLNLQESVTSASSSELNVEQGSVSASGTESWQTVEVGSGGILIVQGSGAAFTAGSAITVDGLFDHYAGSVLTPSLTIDATGAVHDSGGSIAGTTAGLAIYNAGAFDAATAASLSGTTGTFENAGLYEVDNASGSGTTTMGMSLTQDTGSIDITAGTLWIPGSITLDNGTTLTLDGTGTLEVPNLDVMDSTVVQNSGSLAVGDSFVVGDRYLNGAEYFLNGGSISSYEMFVGGFSTATFCQSGGTITTGHTEIGSFGNGTVDQTGGVSTFSDMYLGFNGTGFENLSGGTSTATSISIGQSGTGTFNLSGSAVFTCGYENLGQAGGAGTLTQSGSSTNNVSALIIGNYDSTGSLFTLAGGTLAAGYECVAQAGNDWGSTIGTFVQTGGSNTTAYQVYVGYNWGATGTYKLEGGTLTESEAEIGVFGGTGNVVQTGGTWTVTGPMIAGNGGPGASLNISGGSLSIGGDAYIGYGYQAPATFTQTGGTVSVADDLILSGDGWTQDPAGQGTYTLSGTGRLTTGRIFVGYSVNGLFIQTGGTDQTNALILSGPGGSVGTYNKTGGTLAATVTINVLQPSASGASLVNEGSPYTLGLSATQSVGNDIVDYWSLNWGDGATGTISGDPPSAQHTYYAGGQSYTINATAYNDGDGLASYPSPPVTVLVNDLPANVTVGNQSVNVGSTLSIAATFTDPGKYESHTATVDWGDGTLTSATVAESNGSGTIHASHIYSTYGTYTAAVQVTDSGGAVGTKMFTVTAVPTSLVVTSLSDSPADNSSNSAGDLTLRHAIQLLNNSTGSHTITFASALFSTNTQQTLNLNSGNSALSVSVPGTLTIQGPAANLLTIHAGGHSNVFTALDSTASGPINPLHPPVSTTLNLDNLDITGGQGTYGGGITNYATLNVTDCTISGNSAVTGGGILNTGTLIVENSTISDNSAACYGGGISGGGDLLVVNSTLSGNHANVSGGGIYSYGGMSVLDSTISDNGAPTGGNIYGNSYADSQTLDGSVIAGSTSSGDLAGSFTGDNNLVGDGSGGLSSSNGNILGSTSAPVNPLLSPLGYYGGPTPTMFPETGSPLIGAGGTFNDSGIAIATDQGGFPRGSSPDIGAFQTQPSPVPNDPVVNTVTDYGSSSPSGDISLRDAINQANASTGATTITFDQATFPPNIPTPIALNTAFGPVDIGGTVTINAAGSDVTITAINGNSLGPSSVLHIASGSSVSLEDLTITGGNNVAASGGGITNFGTLAIQDCTITGNTTAYNGGGVYSAGGARLSILDSTISGNTAATKGGGVFTSGQNNNFPPSSITDSTITGNDAEEGGGIYDSAAAVTNCTISGNSASYGGGIYSESGSITDSTIAKNAGAGVDVEGHRVYVNGAFVTSSETQLNGTIIAENTAYVWDPVPGQTPATLDVSGSGFVSTGSGNLIGYGYHNGANNTGLSTAAPYLNLIGTSSANPLNPLLGQLGNYGGPTETIPLLPGSPAIGKGYDASGSPGYDQRADSRGATSDSGSFQSQGFVVTAIGGTGSQSADLNTAFSPLTVHVVSNDGITNLSGGVITFAAPSTGASAVLGSLTVVLGSNNDGSVSATANNIAGSYTVTASPAVGTAAVFSLTNTSPLRPVISLSGDATVAPGSQYTLTFAEAGIPQADITGWSFNWGDGQTSTAFNTANSAPHTYSSQGQYQIQVTLHVTQGTVTQSYVSSMFGLDATFGKNGVVTPPQLLHADATVTQPNGDIVVLDATDQLLECFNSSDGSVNTAFGTEGLVHLGFQTVAAALAVDSSGDLLVAGIDTSGNLDVERLTPVGLPDPQFNNSGVALVEPQAPSTIFAGGASLLVQVTGITGSEVILSFADPSAGSFEMAGILSDGSLDYGFGSHGILIGPSASLVAQANVNGALDEDTGDILLAGTTSTGSVIEQLSAGGLVSSLNLSNTVTALATSGTGGFYAATVSSSSAAYINAFNSSDAPDVGFGSDGVVQVPKGVVSSVISALIAEPDAEVVAVGPQAGNIGAIRYLPDGSLDQTFGQGGIFEIPLSGTGSTGGVAAAESATGQVIAAATLSTGGTAVAKLVRLTATNVVTVQPSLSIVPFGQPQSIFAGDPLQFNAEGSGLPGDNGGLQWTVDDNGILAESVGTAVQYDGYTFYYAPINPGAYTIHVVSSDAAAAAYYSFTVLPNAPTLSLNGPEYAATGSPVVFIATAAHNPVAPTDPFYADQVQAGPADTITSTLSYNWAVQMVDSTSGARTNVSTGSSTGPSVYFVPEYANLYDISVTVTSSDGGASSRASQTLDVGDAPQAVNLQHAIIPIASGGPIPTGDNYNNDYGTQFASAHSVAVDPDGDIIVAGWQMTTEVTGNSEHFGFDVVVACYHSNLTPNSNWGGTGVVYLPQPAFSHAYQTPASVNFEFPFDQIPMTIEPNGTIIVGAFSASNGTNPVDLSELIALNQSNGSTIPAFGDQGIVQTRFTGDDLGVSSTDTITSSGTLSLVALETGNIVAAQVLTDTSDPNHAYWALTEYNGSDGSRLTSGFGNPNCDGVGSVDTAPVGGTGNYGVQRLSLALEPDGSFALGGPLGAGTTILSGHLVGQDVGVVNFDSTGNINASFGSNSDVRGWALLPSAVSSIARVATTKVDGVAYIIVAGTENIDGATQYEVVE